MKYLLDVSVLVAWGWADHVEHDRTAKWVARARAQHETWLLTSAVPELGFVRVSVQRTGGRVTVRDAARTLQSMVSSLGNRHAFLDDTLGARSFPDWCHQASRTTDAHLLELAKARGGKLATLDTGIPGAFLIPAQAATDGD